MTARDYCVWTQDQYEGSWNGDCGACWCLEDATPHKNGMRYCPKCGRRLVRKLPKQRIKP